MSRERPQVVIAGGGVAAVESLLALRELAGRTRSMIFQRSISNARTFASLCAATNISRCARVIAWALARSPGSSLGSSSAV